MELQNHSIKQVTRNYQLGLQWLSGLQKNFGNIIACILQHVLKCITIKHKVLGFDFNIFH